MEWKIENVLVEKLQQQEKNPREIRKKRRRTSKVDLFACDEKEKEDKEDRGNREDKKDRFNEEGRFNKEDRGEDKGNREDKYDKEDRLDNFNKEDKYDKEDRLFQLSASLLKYGLAQPLTTTNDYIILSGHQRYKQLLKLGHKRIDIYRCQQELSQDDIDELTIRLNISTGQWDYDKLANEYDMSMLLDVGFSDIDLGLEPVPLKDSTKTSYGINIKFPNEPALRTVETLISDILLEHDAKYKIRIRKL